MPVSWRQRLRPDQPTDRTADALKLLELNRKQASDDAADRRVDCWCAARDAAARRCLQQLEAMPGVRRRLPASGCGWRLARC
ncbi:MAG: hypothetical protein U0736_14430 [Gemmataceae bacterium]